MFTLAELACACGGELVNIAEAAASDTVIDRVSKDTRDISSDGTNVIYVAITGERFDGHDFTDKAYRSGAAAVLVSDRSKVPEGCPALLVEDTLKAYGDTAKLYRFKLKAKVICVTGSVGKTSTREMIAKALSSSKKVFSTKANQNNEIGMPSTILDAPFDTEVLVLEMGMRLRGEISYLTGIACPDIAVITNVGFSHIERLGSREEIRLAKLEITEGLTDDGILIVNADDEFLYQYVKSNYNGINIAGITAGASDVSDLDRSAEAYGVTFEDGTSFKAQVKAADEHYTSDVALKVTGVHHVRNSLFALMCAKLAGADMASAVKSLEGYTIMDGRGRTVKTNHYTIINDAYNASPESMEAAFFNLNAIKGGRKIAVLGGILELGDHAAALHEAVGRSCASYGFDKIFVTGENSDDFVRGLLGTKPDSVYIVCNDTEDIKDKLKKDLRAGDVILFKASHAFGFEGLAGDIIREDT